MECSTWLGVLNQSDFLPSPFESCQDAWVTWQDEIVVLVQALQWCVIQCRMPPGILCRAVQKLCRCLAPLLKEGDLLGISMLDMVERDPVTPSVSTEKASLLQQRSGPLEEKPTVLPPPYIQEASEPEGATHPEELTLMQRRLPTVPPGFTGSWTEESDPHPRGCSLTGRYILGGPVGPELLGVAAGNSLP